MRRLGAWLAFAVLLVATAISAVWFVGSVRTALIERQSNDWPHVVGTVLEADLDYGHGSSRNEARAIVVFEYEFAGVHHKGVALAPLQSTLHYDDFSSVRIDFPAGRKIDVWVDERDPVYSLLETGVPWADLEWVGGSLLALFAAILGTTWAWRFVRAATITAWTEKRRREYEIRQIARFAQQYRAAESACARDRAGFTRRLYAFSLLPYAYLALLGVLACIAVALVVAGIFSGGRSLTWGWRLLVPLGAIVLVVVRAVFGGPKRFERPGANPRAFPRLVERIDALTRAVEAPKIDRFRFTSDCNASMGELPRRSWFAPARHELTLGLPLLAALSVEHFDAILAHEVGHLSRRHSRASLHLYRAAEASEHALREFQRHGQGLGFVLLLPWHQWFARRFQPLVLAVVRRHELDADAFAAEVVTPRALADALTELVLRNRFLTEHRQSVNVKPGEIPKLKAIPVVAHAIETLALPRDPEQDREWLRDLLLQPTGLDTTHPCLRERLAALLMPPRLATPATSSAADELLGDRKAALANALDEETASFFKRAALKLSRRKIPPAARRHSTN